MQKTIAKNASNNMHYHSTLIKTMTKTGETATTLYDGGFVVYPKSYIETQHAVFNSVQMNVRVINGAGTADTQFVSPGMTFPQFPTTLTYGGRGVKLTWAARFSETAIILNGGEEFEKVSDMIKKNRGVDDAAILRLGAAAEAMTFDREFMTKPGGTFNCLTNPFSEYNLNEYVDYIYKTLFPQYQKEDTVLLYIGNKPTLIAMAKYYILGKDDVNKHNVVCQGEERRTLADHRLFLGKRSFKVPFTNAHLKKDFEGCKAEFWPVFHGSNKVCLNDQGLLPYNDRNEEFASKAVQDYFKLHKLMITNRSEMMAFEGCKFLGTVASTIILEDPLMSEVDCVEDKENPLMLLNARLDVIYAVLLNQENVNNNVLVDETNVFQAAYAGKIEKSSFSHCKALGYRTSFSEEGNPRRVENLQLKDAKGVLIKNAFTHNTERANTFSSYLESCKKDLPMVSDERRQLQAAMLMAPNNLIQILDPMSLYNTNILESRREYIKRTNAAVDHGQDEKLSFMTSIRAGPDYISENISSPALRILAKANGSIFVFKEIVEMCLFMTGSEMPYEVGCSHPGMVELSDHEANANYCAWDKYEFVGESEYCFCALFSHTANVLKHDETMMGTLDDIYNTCFPSYSPSEKTEKKKVGNAGKESYALHFSVRTKENAGNKMTTLGKLNLKNNSGDENGFMSQEAYRKKNSKAVENRNGDPQNSDEGSSSNSKKDGDEDGETDFSKLKSGQSLMECVLKNNTTVLLKNHRIDFSDLGEGEMDEGKDKINQAFQRHVSSMKQMDEVERQGYNSRPLTGGVGSFTLVPDGALLNAILEDYSKTKDYTIPSIQKGNPPLTVKGMKKEEDSESGSKKNIGGKIQIDMEDDCDMDESEMLMNKFISMKRKFGGGDDEKSEECKRKKVSRVFSQDIKNMARAFYFYFMNELDSKSQTPFIYEKIPEEYKNVVNEKYKDFVVYLASLISMNPHHKTLETTRHEITSIIMKTLGEYLRGLGEYFVRVSDTIMEECGFTDHDTMHDRFFMHTSQTDKTIGKEMMVFIDPTSTSDYCQKITERKLLNVMGKQIKESKNHVREACDLDGPTVTTAMTNSDVPHLVETMVPVPHNFQKIGEDSYGDEVIGYTMDFGSLSELESGVRKANSLIPVNQCTYTVMQFKVKNNSLAEERREIQSETWNKGPKTNTEKLTQALTAIYETPRIGMTYNMFPLTCADYNKVTNGGSTGAGSTGPLSTSILSALHSKNKVRFDRILKKDFTNAKEMTKGINFIINFFKEQRSKSANNESCHFSTFIKQLMKDFYQIAISHKIVMYRIMKQVIKIRESQLSKDNGFNKGLKHMLFGKWDVKEGVLEFLDVLKMVMEEHNDVIPILHLGIVLGQIYGSKVPIENKRFNTDLERDWEAGKIATCGVVNVLTSREDNMNTVAAFRGKNVGLGTALTCHSNFSMTHDKYVMICTGGDFSYSGQSRVIFRGSVGNYLGMDNKTIMRSLRMGKCFLPHSLPCDIVNQTGSMVKIGASIMIKTSDLHFRRSERVVKVVDPEEVMKCSDWILITQTIENPVIAKKFFEYICGVLYNGSQPEDLDDFNRDIVKKFFSFMDNTIGRCQVKEEFTKVISSSFIQEEVEYVDDSDCEDYDFFGDDNDEMKGGDE